MQKTKINEFKTQNAKKRRHREDHGDISEEEKENQMYKEYVQAKFRQN